MTKTQYTKLSKYDNYLFTASKADFIRGMTNSDVEYLINVGNELGIYYKNNHCPKCLLDFIKRLSVPYYDYKSKEDKKCSKVKNKI